MGICMIVEFPLDLTDLIPSMIALTFTVIYSINLLRLMTSVAR